MRLSKRAFSHLYDKFAPKIYRFVFFKTGSREVAQDLTAEVFLKTWQYWQEEKKVKHPQAMFYQVARHEIADFYRQHKRYKIISLDVKPLALLDDKMPPDERLLQKEDFTQAWQALQKLKDQQKEVIIWHYLDGLSYSQISQILQKPKGTIRVMVHRAMKNLKKNL